MLKYNKNLKDFARELRSNMTDCEQLLWQRLKGKQVLGIQFYRQKAIGDYIVDFYAPKAKLVIEVDGGQHYEDKNKTQDLVRDRFLEDQGLRVLRFSNREIIENSEGVLETVHRTVEFQIKDQIPPDPPLLKGGEKAGHRG